MERPIRAGWSRAARPEPGVAGRILPSSGNWMTRMTDAREFHDGREDGLVALEILDLDTVRGTRSASLAAWGVLRSDCLKNLPAYIPAGKRR
jgi:hypothetical protein